jgi:hypothetical protein
MTLILPNGLAPKKTQPLTEAEMQWLAIAEDVCRKLNVVIACPRCLAAGMKAGAVLRGANDPSDTTLSVTCDCRRLVFEKPAAH